VGRVGQFVAHLTARVGLAEEARARDLLPEGARLLFAAMPTADRRHGLRVAARLAAEGRADPDLLVAALLHDAAKGRRLRLWHRVAGVLLQAVAPRSLARLAVPGERSWRYPFHLFLHHADLSAAAALRAGCSQRTAAFIRGAAPAADAALAAALRRADEAG
jgi:hypothetical protein